MACYCHLILARIVDIVQDADAIQIADGFSIEKILLRVCIIFIKC